MNTQKQQPKTRKKDTQITAPEAIPVRHTAAIPNFDALPDSAMIRQSQMVRDPKHPTRPTPIPFSPATLWRKVRAGTFPAPYRLSAAVTAWKVGDLRAWLNQQTESV